MDKAKRIIKYFALAVAFCLFFIGAGYELNVTKRFMNATGQWTIVGFALPFLICFIVGLGIGFPHFYQAVRSGQKKKIVLHKLVYAILILAFLFCSLGYIFIPNLQIFLDLGAFLSSVWSNYLMYDLLTLLLGYFLITVVDVKKDESGRLHGS